MKYKVVINSCFGGFGISQAAAEWLLARGASPKKVEVHHHQSYRDSDEGWISVTCDLDRHDPLLVECVETLGATAGGDCSELEVVEIEQPLYRITEYDGAESIQQPNHLSWTNASKIEV